MGRILAIDYGGARCGLAVTDPEQLIATPLGFKPTDSLKDYLLTYCSSEKVDAFVLGFPTKLDGSDTNATPLVRSFAEWLQTSFPNKKIVLQDEYGSSGMAVKSMVSGGMKKKKRKEKGQTDSIAATLILQSYLEEK